MFFRKAEQEFYDLLSPFANKDKAKAALFKTEIEHINDYGYGIVPFMLSMIETALQLSDHRLPQSEIDQIIAIGHRLLNHPVDILPDVEMVLKHYAKSEYRVMMITKGTLQEQERKIAFSSLKHYFDAVEIVSHKTEQTYREIWERHSIIPEQFVMVGNSLKSDILPVVKAGGHAIYIPHEQTWAFEQVTEPEMKAHQFCTLSHIRKLMSTI